MSDEPASEIVEHVTALGFEATLEKLTAAIAAAGLQLFAKIDHAANAHEIGMSMPSATVLIYGHARGGTPIMLAEPRAALDLPLRVLVREQDGKTVVAFHPMEQVLLRAGVPQELAGRLDPAQQLLLKALAEG